MAEKRISPWSRLNFYKFKDYVVQGLHLAALAGIAAAAGFWAGPYIFATAALIATGVTVLGRLFIDKFAPEYFRRRRLGLDTHPALTQIFDEFTHKAKLKRTPELYDFSSRGSRPKFLPRSLQYQFQAAATGLNRPVGSSRVDLQACKLEYSIVSPK